MAAFIFGVVATRHAAAEVLDAARAAVTVLPNGRVRAEEAQFTVLPTGRVRAEEAQFTVLPNGRVRAEEDIPLT